MSIEYYECLGLVQQKIFLRSPLSSRILSLPSSVAKKLSPFQKAHSKRFSQWSLSEETCLGK
jgi:hypothetical protein